MRSFGDLSQLAQPGREVALILARDFTARQTGFLGGPRGPADTERFFDEQVAAAVDRYALGFYEAHFPLRLVVVAACEAAGAVLNDLSMIAGHAGSEGGAVAAEQRH